MKDFFQRKHIVICAALLYYLEKRRHLRLPSRVDGMLLHRSASPNKIRCLEIADQQAVWSQEQGIVMPSGLVQSVQHLRPHMSMALFVLVQPFGANLQ